MASEELSRYATDKNFDIAQLQTATSRYVADTNAAASRYSADKNAETQRYAIDTNAATSRYSTDVNAATQRYATDKAFESNQFRTVVDAATSRYATDTNADVQTYRTDVESKDRQARLEFDQKTQEFNNSLNTLRTSLEKARTEADLDVALARSKQIAQETTKLVADMKNDARRLGLAEEAQKYENALRTAQTVETSTRAYRNHVDSISAVFKLLQSVARLGV